MTTEHSVLKQAASPHQNRSDLPEPARVVEALLQLEKAARKEPTTLTYSDLIGSWNLRFITGTKKTRQRAGVVLGAGKYIPRFVKIQIAYEGDRQSNEDRGRVKNSVTLAFIELSLSGPTKMLPHKSILAFDFTAIEIVAFGFKLYDGYVKNGAEREAKFYHQTIKEQAFFNYFCVSEDFIAARGKGGGLALWGREY